MDKAEYQNRLDALNQLVKDGNYKGALEIVESIDWRRVKSIRTLTMVADVYEENKMYEEEQAILLIAYDRSTLGKNLLYRLTEISVKLQDFEGAKEYYGEFVKVAGHDISRYILKYEIYKGTGEPLEKQIEVLEQYTQLEFEEKWAYELAVLYSKNGEKEKCLRTCDDLILWFNEGRYVIKALKLKKKYGSITASQSKKLDELLGADDTNDKKKAASSGKAVVMNSTDSIQENVAQDMRTVFPARPKMESDLLQNKPMPADYIDPSEYAVRDLEPESLSVQVNPSPDAKATIVTKPVKKAKDQYANLDLDALFAETASGFSEEVQDQIVTREEEQKKEDAATEAAVSTEPEEKQEEEDTFTLEDVICAALVHEENEIAAEKAGEDEKEETIPEPEEDQETVKEAEVPENEEPESEKSESEQQESGPSPLNISIQKASRMSAYRDPMEEARYLEQAENLSGELIWEESAQIENTPEITAPDQNREQEKDTVPDETESAEMIVPVAAEPVKEKVPNADGVIPMSVEEVLREETGEEKRFRILNEERPEKLDDEQKRIFTYFMKVPGMEEQIVGALNQLYDYAGEKTSRRGNIAIMGGYGTGKSRLFDSFVREVCTDMKLSAVKIARLDASDLNTKDPAQVVAKMSGGFLLIERAGLMYPETIKKLSQAMDFRTDRLVLVIEDEKVSMRGLLHNYPEFADKFGSVISIPVFTNDELVTFAKTYAKENGYRMDELGVLALYTKIGENQRADEPMTITEVKKMVDGAMHNAQKGSRKFGRKLSRRRTDSENRIILYEKDFE